MDKFKWGLNFFTLNQTALDLYALCSTSQQLHHQAQSYIQQVKTQNQLNKLQLISLPSQDDLTDSDTLPPHLHDLDTHHNQDHQDHHHQDHQNQHIIQPQQQIHIWSTNI